MTKHYTYLGDGLYAAFDGYMLELCANGHDRANGATEIVYLEPGILDQLDTWIRRGYPDYNTGEKFPE